MNDHLNISTISVFVKKRRKLMGLTQKDLSIKAGVGLRFIRDLEQGKASLRIDKVNQVLMLFGHILGPAPLNKISSNGQKR